MSAWKDLARVALARGVAGWLTRTSRPLPSIDGVTLVVSPHPDDEILGCGGLLARQARGGRRVHVLLVTDGEASHPGHPTVTPAVLGARRREESIRALGRLGIQQPRSAVTFLQVADGRLGRLPAAEGEAVIDVLAKWIRADRPEVVCAPYLGGGSSEHDAVARWVAEALRRAGGGVLLEYPVWAWWRATRLRPRLRRGAVNYRLALDGLAQAKREALAEHASQVASTPPWTRPVLPAALARACGGGVEFYFRTDVAADTAAPGTVATGRRHA